MIMSPKKLHLHIDFDYGRPGVQQVSCENDLSYVESLSTNNYQSWASCPNQSLVSEHSNNLCGNNSKSSLKSSSDHTDMFPKEYQTKMFYSDSPLSMCMTNEEIMNLRMINKGVHLKIKTSPEQRFRYRYDTEMSGTHGSLQGLKGNSEKSAPEVELVNYPYEAFIRVSLVTCNEIGERYPHPHSLFIKQKLYQKKIYENLNNKPLTKTGHYSDPHYIRVGMNGANYVARFEGMCIISSKKENFSASIKEKFRIRDLELGPRHGKRDDILKKVDEAVKLVDLDFVTLCFEAFRKEGGRLIPICPPLYSDPIGNAKSANTGRLKISRINKCSGNCLGGDEVWLLVEKINKKGLMIRFYEESDGKLLWESCVQGDDITLHHQYAIIFKTPPYRDPNITTEVKVYLRLERSQLLSQTADFSEPITFIYEPIRNRSYRSDIIYRKEPIVYCNKQTHIKRPRTESPVVPTVDYQYKRKKDEQESSNATFDDADLDHILSDNSLGPNNLNQQWPGFNVEEFLQFFGEEPEMVHGDGTTSEIRHRWDLMQLFRQMCAKSDENEVKNLAERINDIKFTKGRSAIESETEEEKKDVEDAVSTLLSLRESTVDINRLRMEPKKDESKSLHRAVLQNRPDMLRQLVKSSNFSEKDENDNTPLHLSLLLKHDSCTECLLEYHQEMRDTVNLKNKEGKTALHLAAANGCLHHVILILESGADVNDPETKTKRNALHIAMIEQNLDVAEYLLRSTDVSLDAVDAEGRSPSSMIQTLLPSERSRFEKLFESKEKNQEVADSEDLENDEEDSLDKLYEVLNETGSWRMLAEILNCSYMIASAEDAENPTEFLLTNAQNVHGDIEIETLRNLLDMINEKKGLMVLDEILARKFL